MLAQGLLDFQYEADSSSHGLTSLGGLPVYLDLIKASGLGPAIRRHVGIIAGLALRAAERREEIGNPHL